MRLVRFKEVHKPLLHTSLAACVSASLHINAVQKYMMNVVRTQAQALHLCLGTGNALFGSTCCFAVIQTLEPDEVKAGFASRSSKDQLRPGLVDPARR